MTTDPLLALRLEHFTCLVGSDVGIDFGSGPVSARVLSADRIGGHTVREGGAFSVMLKAPAHGRPAQGTFKLDLPEFGKIGLFMSPRRLDGNEAVYEFILN